MNGDVPMPLEELPLEIRKHLSVCDCSCDHMGFGNYQSLRRQQQRTPPPPPEFTDLGTVPVRPCDLVSDHVFPADHNFHVLTVDGERTYGSLNHVIRAAAAGPSDVISDVSSCEYADPLQGEDLATAEHIRLEEQRKQRTRGRRLACGYLCWLCCAVLVVALAAGVGVSVPLVLQLEPSAGLEERLHTAKQILQQVPLIDGHNDLPWNIRKFVHNNLRIFNFTADLRRVKPWASSQWSHTDIPRLREGHVGAQFWAAYVPCESQYKNAVQMTLEQVDLIKRVVRQYSDYLSLALTAEDILKGHKEGKIVSLIGLEGGHSIQSTLASLRAMYELGVRYMTLTHTCDTPWAECAPIPGFQKPAGPQGLTRFGLTVIREMNRLGMMIDLSHVSEAAMRHALEHSQAPVIFSHSSAQALCNSSRNVPDYLLKKLAVNGGIVMVSFYNYFLTCNGTAQISDVVAHINHIRRVAGVDHVGIGAGYDGINSIPTGLEDVSRYPYLFAELLRDTSWSVLDLQKLAGLNLIRAFRKVEQVRDQMSRQGIEPLEELIPRRDLDGKLNCTYSLYRMRQQQQQRGRTVDDDVRDNHS